MFLLKSTDKESLVIGPSSQQHRQYVMRGWKFFGTLFRTDSGVVNIFPSAHTQDFEVI